MMKQRISFAFILILIILIEVVIASPATAAIRIMPLGNSITQGYSSGEFDPDYQISYRKVLRDLLVADGYEIDFVGSLSNGSAVFGDSQHEGHPGWRADELRDQVYNWLNSRPADVILLHVGTNDVSGWQTPAGIAFEVSQILDNIDQYESDHGVKITVILALIVNRLNYQCFNASWTTTYNDSLYNMAMDRIDLGDRIVIIDLECSAGIDYRMEPAGDMWDTWHPIETGYTKMAYEWFYTLQPVLDAINSFTCNLDPWFQQTTLYNGTKYYTDRDYVLTGVPGAYAGMNLIKTPNNDRNFTTPSYYLNFTMPDTGTVYVAFDSRAVSEPDWMNGFTDTGDVLLTSFSSQPSLKIYSRAYGRGDCVQLGAAKAPGFEGSTASNFIVFYRLERFLTYKAKTSSKTTKFQSLTAFLSDQFEGKYFDVKKMESLLNPAGSNIEEIQDMESHLIGYQIKKATGEAKHQKQENVIVTNEFGTLIMDTKKSDSLFVPSAKNLENPVEPLDPINIDHFKCYSIKVNKKVCDDDPTLKCKTDSDCITGTCNLGFPKGVQRQYVDQFDQEKLFDIKKPTKLCTPVDIGDGGIIDEEISLMCYQAKKAKGEPKHVKFQGIYINNQFGADQLGPGENWQVDTVKEEEICIRSLIQPFE